MASLSVGLKKADQSSFDFAALPRTYESALHLLSLLPTNRDVTSLFEAPPDDGSGRPFDLNALAIPEVVAWMARAGYTDLANDLAPLRCIHVAGTKGKGSVCAFATAILVEAADREAADREAASPPVPGSHAAVGRVGTYMSPHVVSVRERIWLDGRPMERALFAKYTFEVWERLSQGAMAADPTGPDPYGAHTKPFYFRFLTLLALHVFLREGVRSAVVECGIGGEYDATNLLPASSVTATAVSRLGIDHVAMLGATLPEIAWHKAGIFKEGVVAFSAQGPEPETETEDGVSAARAVLCERAASKKALALCEIDSGAVDAWDGVADATLPGPFQKHNMALAAAAALCHLGVVGSSLHDASVSPTRASFDPATLPAWVCGAMARATLRGRCETVQDKSHAEFLIDGAHTTDSLAAVSRHFHERMEGTNASARRVLLFTVRDRRPGELLEAVVRAGGATPFDHAFFVFSADAANEVQEIRQAVSRTLASTTAHFCSTTRDAIDEIRALCVDPSVPVAVLATGSFVLAREVLQVLAEE